MRSTTLLDQSLSKRAEQFRKFVRANRPETAYAAFVDYGIDGETVRYVHLIVCDQAGRWVLVDLQNSHHETFMRIDPKGPADCHRMLVARLRSGAGRLTVRR